MAARRRLPRVCSFDMPGAKSELYPLERLAEDICPSGPLTIDERRVRFEVTRIGEPLKSQRTHSVVEA